MAYDYDTAFQALQLTLQSANNLAQSEYSDIKPLVILLERFLREDMQIVEKEERSRIRYGILSTILNREITSNYDISPDESHRIFFFLCDENNGFEYHEGSREFLTDLAARAKIRGGYQERPLPQVGVRVPPKRPHLPGL